VAAVWLGLPTAAGAQTPAQINRIKGPGIARRWRTTGPRIHESARIGLREAIALANRAGLLNDPLMARLWLHLAAVLINGVGDAEKGAKAVAVAVRIDPGIQLPNSLSTPALKEAPGEGARRRRQASRAACRGRRAGGGAARRARRAARDPSTRARRAARGPAAEPEAEPKAEAAPPAAQAPEAAGQLG
jgi:hypothetical protein